VVTVSRLGLSILVSIGLQFIEVPMAGIPESTLIGEAVGGSYIITKVIGEGGMGQVYLASSKMLANKLAAVKVLSRECSESPDAMARFRAEIFATGKIQDSNIVKVFDAGKLADGRTYMMMEYCNGGSLDDLLAVQMAGLPLDLILNLIGPVASVLDEAHNEAKITHRDVKPANILLVKEPASPLRSRLGDFGIAKLHADKLEERIGTRRFMGSVGYVAPEQCDFEKGSGQVDHRADVYALASVMYHMCTGRPPYHSGTLYQMIENVANNRTFPRPEEIRAGLPQKCSDAILAGLEHDREKRIQSVKDLVLRFAEGVPNGDALIAFVAPRLVRSALAPNAKTISQDIGPAVMQWTAVRAQRANSQNRQRQGAMFAAALVTGVVLTVVAQRLLHKDMMVATVHPPEVAAVNTFDATAPPTVVMAVDARFVDAAVRVVAAVVPNASPDARQVPIAMPDASPAATTPGPATPPPTSSPTSVAAVKAKAGPGMIQIKAKPFAEVEIDGVAVGSAPLTKRVSAGSHKVVLIGPDDKMKPFTISVAAGETKKIDWSW
jgi:serine/threonine protein kinase